MVFCGKCGTENPDGSAFCNRCGSAIGSNAPTGSTNERMGPVTGTASERNGAGSKNALIAVCIVIAFILIASVVLINSERHEEVDPDPIVLKQPVWNYTYESYPILDEVNRTVWYVTLEMKVTADDVVYTPHFSHVPDSFDEYTDMELLKLRELSTYKHFGRVNDSDHVQTDEDARVVKAMMESFNFLESFTDDRFSVHFTNGVDTVKAYHFIKYNGGEKVLSLYVGQDGVVYGICEHDYYEKTHIGTFHLPGWHQVEDFQMF